MEVSPIQNSTQPVETSSRTEISSDFETFLRMLTVQMENQDPLNPVDSADFAVQLATFSNVEQQVQTNELLRAMQDQMGASDMAQLADWVGREVRSSAPAQLDGSPVTLYPTVEPGAERAVIVVRNSDGGEMTRLPINTDGALVEWAGVTADGFPFPQDTYTFDVESYSGEDVIGTTPAETFATVTEVRRIADGSSVIVLTGDVEVSADSVTALRAAQ